jgi:UDP-N-acetylmuramoylalanine--D-glutamate ligase
MAQLLTTEFEGKRIAVIGLAATGLATARVLRDLGAIVTVADARPAEKLNRERLQEARALDGVALVLGSDEIAWNVTDIVVPSPGVPRYAPVLKEAVWRGVPILSEIEVAYRIAQAPILAITGTNGKTTTTALLGAICRTAGLRTWVAGNIAEDGGVRQPLIEAALYAPAEKGVIVAEISSFQLEWVEQFRPRVAAWLNLTDDHLDRHADQNEYAEAKANIFKSQTVDDWAVVNDDDPIVMRYAEGVGAGQRIRFGLSRHVWGHAPGQPCAYLDGHQLIAENIAGHAAELNLMSRRDIPVPGLHNVANVLAAASMALAFGIDVGSIRAAVRTFKGVPHRMEYVATVDGVRFVNNSMCTNPAAVLASLQAVEGPVVAIVGGEHKGGDLTTMIDGLREHARHVVLIGSSAQEIGDLLSQRGATPTTEYADTLTHAVAQARSHARVGDTVLLVPGCASFDMFTGFEQRGQVFREAVRAQSGAMGS